MCHPTLLDLAKEYGWGAAAAPLTAPQVQYPENGLQYIVPDARVGARRRMVDKASNTRAPGQSSGIEARSHY